MDYFRQIADKWRCFNQQDKYEVDRDLGNGSAYKLIGRSGLIFARGPYCWEFNADAKIYGGAFLVEMKSWCFTADIKQTVQFITRKSCDLTAKRQLFLRDSTQTRLVRKYLCENKNSVKICDVNEVDLIFFRMEMDLPPMVGNDLKALAKIRWCRYTDSWFTSSLYRDELRKIIFDFNQSKDQFDLFK